MALTVAVVGTGYWGRNHVRTLAALRDEGTIAALVVCDLDEERAKSLAREFGCVWETDAAKLATKHSVTAATIATPTPQHASLAISLMEQGVNVLVEKPLAMNEIEAKSVLDAAQRTGRVLMVGHLFRYHAAVRKAAELIA